MKHTIRISTAVWLLIGLAVLTSPVWGQTTTPIQNGQVDRLRHEGQSTGEVINLAIVEAVAKVKTAVPAL